MGWRDTAVPVVQDTAQAAASPPSPAPQDTVSAQPKTDQDWVRWGAKELGVPPEHLAAVMANESSLNPKAWGGDGGQYYGLIQFGPDARKDGGVDPTTDGTFAAQMPKVVDYFKQHGFDASKYPDPKAMQQALYSTVLSGNPNHVTAADSNGTSAAGAADRLLSGDRHRQAAAFLQAGSAPNWRSTATPVIPDAAGTPKLDAVLNPTGVTQTALHHGLQGLTGGYSDELGGLGTAAMQGVANLLPKSFAQKHDIAQAPAMDAYRASRDTERDLMDAQQKANPGTALASQLGGGAILQSLTGAPMVPLAAAEGLGRSDADLTKGDLGEYGKAALDTGTSAATAAVLNKLVGKIASGLSNRAGTNAFKAAGPMLKDTRAVGVDEIPNVGRRLLDMGAIPKRAALGIGGTAEDIGKRAAAMAGKTGKEIGEIKQAADAAGAKFDPHQVADTIEKQIVAPIKNDPALADYANEMQKYADRFRALAPQEAEQVAAKVAPKPGPLENYGKVKFTPPESTANIRTPTPAAPPAPAGNPLSQLIKSRENFDDVIKFNQKNQTPQTARLLQLRALLDELQYRGMNKVSPELAKMYAEKQADYAIQRPVAKMAQDMADRQAANLQFGLADRIVGAGIGVAFGGYEGGRPGLAAGAAAGATLGSKLLRTRGPAAAAVLEDMASKGIQKVAPLVMATVASKAAPPLMRSMGKVGHALASNPESLGHYGLALQRAAAQGPDALATRHFVLSADPKFQQHIESLPDAPSEEAP